jgi:hypothetical protein
MQTQHLVLLGLLTAVVLLLAVLVKDASQGLSYLSPAKKGGLWVGPPEGVPLRDDVIPRPYQHYPSYGWNMRPSFSGEVVGSAQPPPGDGGVSQYGGGGGGEASAPYGSNAWCPWGAAPSSTRGPGPSGYPAARG